MNWRIVTATNNESVLRSCLLSSPDLSDAEPVIQQKGFRSAAVAYNAAIDTVSTDVLVFVHQDVYFPAGWKTQFEQALHALNTSDPGWAVAGSWGVQKSGQRAGHLYCAGLGRVLGKGFESPCAVRTLDEVILVLRKSSGVRFDENLPGYHFYGTDLCLEAEQRGLKCYALAALCIHNTNGYGMLPWDFWSTYFFMRRKWFHRLPVTTPCIEITRWCWPMIRWNLARAKNIALGKHLVRHRVADPTSLLKQHEA